jgi:hypothetical protein
MWVPQTDELFSFHYFGNPEMQVIKHPSKIQSLQAIAFDGICVKALFLAWASVPSDSDAAGRHRQDRNMVR